jgi:hypothetical protein
MSDLKDRLTFWFYGLLRWLGWPDRGAGEGDDGSPE